MRVNHNGVEANDSVDTVVSDLCKDTKMRVNHNTLWERTNNISLFLIYAKILK